MERVACRGSQTALGSIGQCHNRGQQSGAHPEDRQKQEHGRQQKAKHTYTHDITTNIHGKKTTKTKCMHTNEDDNVESKHFTTNKKENADIRGWRDASECH